MIAESPLVKCLICKSLLSPNFAFTSSPNFKLSSDLSNTIFLVFAVWKVTSSPKFDVELASIAPVNVERPDTFKSVVSNCP